MRSKIEIHDIKTYAYHGCMEMEASIGAYYSTNIIMEADISYAAKNDDLDRTINYASVNDIVLKQMSVRSRLIENVCFRILKEIKKAFPQVEHLTVRVSKLNPPVSGATSSATVELSE